MGGLLVLLLAGLYLWIVYVAIRKVPKVWGKALALVVAVLIPTADAVYGRIKLKQLCETEGGMKIFKTVEGVEGFYAENSDDYDDWITKFGYRFVEGMGSGQGVARKKLGIDGKVSTTASTAQMSLYRLSKENAISGLGLNKHRMVVTIQETGEELGSYTYFGFEGGWAERFIASLYAQTGFGGDCGSFSTYDKKTELVTKTLRKAK